MKMGNILPSWDSIHFSKEICSFA